MRLVDLPEELESPDDVPDGMSVLVTISKASVLDAGGSQNKKVVVFREDYPSLSEAEGDLIGIWPLQTPGVFTI
jgi:hypothetical protein